MADSEKPKPPESPTTARELDFDDDAQESLVSPTRNSGDESRDEIAPPKPPRPVNPQQQAENTLKEAFPSIDASVIRAVLRASGGSIEPAFNALLGMSDPDAQTEPAPPPQPPRRPTAPTSTAQSQLAADEQYARQLAEHYNGPARYDSRGRQPLDARGPRRTTSNQFGEDGEKERSFFDDDLPIIRDNIKKGFLETQSKVNSWVTNLRKKIDGEEDDNIEGSRPPPASGYSSGPIGATRQPSYGRRSGDYKRRSTDHERYDADPQVLGDDFTGLQLRDAEGPPRRSSRPLANPDLFKPTPPRPQSGNGRRVSFQDGPPEEIGVQQRRKSSPDPSKRPSSGASGRSSKWQPLSAVDPNPVGDHDPFSLGDSDDEDAKKKDLKPEDDGKVEKATAEAMTDDIGSSREKTEPHVRSGDTATGNQGADELSGKATG